MNIAWKISLFTFVFLSLLLLTLLVLTPAKTYAWETYADFSEMQLPFPDAGATNMTFTASEPIVFKYRYTETPGRIRDSIGPILHLSGEEPFIDSAYPAMEASRGEFAEDGYLFKPVYADSVKDVYTHKEEIPLAGTIRLVSGSICVQEDQNTPVCLSQSGETHRIATQQPIRIVVTGEDGSSYLPSFTVGDGIERHDIVNNSFKAYFAPDTLYRMLWFDFTYTEDYTDHIRAEISRLRKRIRAYEPGGGCPCIAFEPNNPEHYLPENIPNICRLGGWGDGYFPTMEIGRTISRDLLWECPPEPSAEFKRGYNSFIARAIAGYTRLAPRFGTHLARFYFQEGIIGGIIRDFENGERSEDELLSALSDTQEIIRQAYYLTPDI